jgi:hypothetical protein
MIEILDIYLQPEEVAVHLKFSTEDHKTMWLEVEKRIGNWISLLIMELVAKDWTKEWIAMRPRHMGEMQLAIWPTCRANKRLVCLLVFLW